jgi:tRNA(His) guanylyltransferase
MKQSKLEERMRLGECYHGLRVPPGLYIVVRVDGRSFSRLTERLVEKPFDPTFHRWMVTAARGLLDTLQARYVYTESDEISALLPRDADLFDREVEKLASISAARASALFSLACGEAVEFDGRLWVGARDQDVVDYFRWRQSDATRCALNGWCHWTLRKAGKSASQASRAIEGLSVSAKNELLHRHEINFNEVPAWQRRGTGLSREEYQREGFNPKTQEKVLARRRRIRVDDELPMKDAYSAYLRAMLG